MMTSKCLFFSSIARIRHVTTVVIELRSKESGIVASRVERLYDDVVEFHAALGARAGALGFAPPGITTSDAFFSGAPYCVLRPRNPIGQLLTLFRDAHSPHTPRFHLA